MFGPFSNMDLKFKSFKVASLGPSGWPHARSNKYIQVKVWGDAAVGLWWYMSVCPGKPDDTRWEPFDELPAGCSMSHNTTTSQRLK